MERRQIKNSQLWNCCSISSLLIKSFVSTDHWLLQYSRINLVFLIKILVDECIHFAESVKCIKNKILFQNVGENGLIISVLVWTIDILS